MKYYPVYINLKNKNCFLVGGGKVGERKAIKLLNAGASLTVISPDLTPELESMHREDKFVYINRCYLKGDLQNAFLTIVATSNVELNAEISSQAPGLVNVVDMPDLCNFIVPSIVEKGDLSIAISTSGVSPALSKTIRKDLEKVYSEEFSEYLVFLKDFRKRILSSSFSKSEKEQILKKAGSMEALEKLKSKGTDELKDMLKGFLS